MTPVQLDLVDLVNTLPTQEPVLRHGDRAHLKWRLPRKWLKLPRRKKQSWLSQTKTVDLH